MDTKEEIQKTLLTEPIKLLIKCLAYGSPVILTPLIYLLRELIAKSITFTQLLLIAAIQLAIILSLLAVVFILRRKLKTLTEYVPRFGVCWDKEGNPRCPSCSTYLNLSTGKTTEMTCIKCNKTIPIAEDTGQLLSLNSAKLIISGKYTSNQILEIKQKINVLDNLSIEFLRFVASYNGDVAYHQVFHPTTNVHPITIDQCVEQLEEKGYILGVRYDLISGYELTSKGRQYLIDNDHI